MYKVAVIIYTYVMMTPECQENMVKQMRIIFFLLISSLLLVQTGCVTQKTTVEDSSKQPSAIAGDLPSDFEVEINKILELINNNELTLASYQVQVLEEKALTGEDTVLLAYAKASLFLAQENLEAAYLTLTEPSLDEKTILTQARIQIMIGLLKADVFQQKGKNIEAIQQRIFLAPIIESQDLYLHNHLAIWNNLNLLPAEEIDNALLQKDDTEFYQWLKLSKIVQHGNLILDQQINAIDKWQRQYPIHPAALIPLPEIAAIRNATNQLPESIAIILPFDSKYRNIAEAIRDGFMSAYYKTNHKPQLNFYSIDESQSFVSIYNEAIYDGADMVIGPLFKNQLEELYKLGTLPVTTIALNKLDQIDKPLNLYEFSLSTEDEILSIIEHANTENLHNALVIAQDDNKAQKNIDFFTDHWLTTGNNVLNTSIFSTTREQSKVIQTLLNIEKSNQRIRELQWLVGNLNHEPRRRKDIDMIMMFAKSESAISLRPLLAFHYANDIPIYATSSVYRGYPKPAIDADLNGIRFTDIPLTLYNRESVANKYQHSSLIRLYAFGFDAFQLSERVKLMEGLSDIKLYGATGLITLQESQLKRNTSFAKFSRGIAIPLPMVMTQ